MNTADLVAQSSVIGALVRERPLMAGAAALAAGWIFMRNPALATVVAAAPQPIAA